MGTDLEDPSNQPRVVAFYSALVSAWIQSRMERDKALIALSSAGIGLLVTLASTVGAPDVGTGVLYCVGFFGFVVTLVSCLHIYQRNTEHIEKLLKNQRSADPVLERFDRISLCGFVLGVASLAGLGVVSAVLGLTRKGVVR